MKKIDICIIAVVIVLASVFGGYSYYKTSKNHIEKYVRIYVDNKLYKVVPLNDKSANQTIEIKNWYGDNIIRIENGSVRILDGDCPDKVCVKSGVISEIEQSLVCFPHRLVVIIKDGSSGKLEDASN
ncbi:MAG: NusG domain II-containing protein [Clostridiaceae bacterium]|nr:NusG domain II-containing protein [Clostridiaceae bacterium]